MLVDLVVSINDTLQMFFQSKLSSFKHFFLQIQVSHMLGALLNEAFLLFFLFLRNLLLDEIELHFSVLFFNFLLVLGTLYICKTIVLHRFDCFTLGYRLDDIFFLLRNIGRSDVLKSHVSTS